MRFHARCYYCMVLIVTRHACSGYAAAHVTGVVFLRPGEPDEEVSSDAPWPYRPPTQARRGTPPPAPGKFAEAPGRGRAAGPGPGHPVPDRDREGADQDRVPDLPARHVRRGRPRRPEGPGRHGPGGAPQGLVVG